MPYDPITLERVRRVLSERTDVVEKPIIGGGRGFMVGGHLCCGVSAKGLTVRVGAEARAEILAEPHVRPLVVGGRETAAFIVVEQPGYQTDEALKIWIDRGLRFVATLPSR